MDSGAPGRPMEPQFFSFGVGGGRENPVKKTATLVEFFFSTKPPCESRDF